MAYGVTPGMIAAFGDVIFDLSLNKQRRRGDPVRELDFAAIAAQRAAMGLSDAEIAERVGLSVEQARYIRVVTERRRFRTDQYRKLFGLGGGRRWRPERYADPAARTRYGEGAMALRQAMTFDPAEVARFVAEGWWTNQTLSSCLAAHAAAAPERPALVLGEQGIGYGELKRRVDRLAGALVGLGLAKGDVVAVQLPNVPEFVIAFLAVASFGGVTATVHMPYRHHEIETLVRHSGARAAICMGEIKDFQPAAAFLDVAGRVETLHHVIAVGAGAADGALDFADLIAGSRPAEMLNPPVAADPFLLLYTSGTTDQPKGVPLSYQNMLSNAELSAEAFALRADDVLLSAAPLSHLFGLYSVHLALVRGATMALLPAFSPPGLVDAISAGRPTLLFTAPAHIAACLQAGLFEGRDLASLRYAILSGSACPEPIVRAFDQLMTNGDAGQLWGMTELQAGLFTRPGDGIDVAARTAGRAAPGNQVRIVGADGSVLPAGDEGELQARGASVFPGYYDNDAANAAAFTADGWFRSGDLAVMDAAGNVAITGRIKDVINRGGVKYNPRDVEDLLATHPAIQIAAIVPMPDPVLGERACCFAVAAAGEAPTLAALCDHLQAHGIAKNKLPERLVLIDDMPLTPTRKVIKGRLIERLAATAEPGG